MNLRHVHLRSLQQTLGCVKVYYVSCNVGLIIIIVTEVLSSSVDCLCGPQCQRQRGVLFSLWSHELGSARAWRLEQLPPEIHGRKGYECTTIIRELFLLEQRCTDFCWTLLKCFHVLFCGPSGVWTLVWPRERLVEEEADLFKTPLHFLRRYDRGISVVFVASSYSGYFSKALLQLVIMQWCYLTIVFPGYWTGNRQTLQLCRFVAFSRREEQNYWWSAVW